MAAMAAPIARAGPSGIRSEEHVRHGTALSEAGAPGLATSSRNTETECYRSDWQKKNR